MIQREPKGKLPRWSGEPRVLTDALNLLADAIDGLGKEIPELTEGTGVRLLKSKGRVVITAARGIGTGGAPESTHPFKGQDASRPAGPGGSPPALPAVSVIFGTVNSIVPTIEDAITEEVVPLDGTTDDPARAPILECPESGGVWLKAIWTEFFPGILGVTSAEVVFAPTATPPENDSATSYYLLANVAVAGDAVTSVSQAVTHSLFVQRVECSDSISYYWNAV